VPVWNPVSQNMRLNFGDKVPFEVMSDSSLHPKVSSSATHNIVNTSPPAVSQGSNSDNSPSNSQKDSMGVLSSASASTDVEANDSHLRRLSSTSEIVTDTESSIQQQTLSPFDNSAYDEESLEATKKDNAKSAFEITSVRPAADDHDRSVLRNPVSTDSLRDTLQNELGAKSDTGESNDSIVVPSNVKQLGQSPSDAQEGVVTPHFVVGSPKNDEDRPAVVQDEIATPSTTKVGGVAAKNPVSNEDPVVSAYPSNASSSTVGTVVGGGAIAGNGTSVQPNRFRRVNQYERGRWTVRDSLVTEEQGETTTSSVSTIVHLSGQNSKHLASISQQPEAENVGEPMGKGTPPRTVHQRLDQPLPTTTAAAASTTTTTNTSTTTDSLHFQQMATDPVNLPGNNGGVGASDLASDRDSSSVHMDKNSTAADTLSRNTSMSSIVPERSIDGEELHDSEGDSISGGGSMTGGGGGTVGGGGGTHGHNQDQDLSELSMSSSGLTNPPVISTASVGAIAPSLQTAIPRHQEPSFLSGSSGSDIRKDSEYFFFFFLEGGVTRSVPLWWYTMHT